MEIEPPGAVTSPRISMVPALKETVADGSVNIEEPASITMSPRISNLSTVNGSSFPKALKDRLTGFLKPCCSNVSSNTNPSSPISRATRLVATGAIRLSFAMTTAGT
jgi:hypothetical protein